jgi:hypothetical protein
VKLTPDRLDRVERHLLLQLAEKAVRSGFAQNLGLREQSDSLTLRRMAVDGLTGQAEGRRCPPAHACAVRVFAVRLRCAATAACYCHRNSTHMSHT